MDKKTALAHAITQPQNESFALRQDLLRRFDALAISAEIGVMKPDAAAYQAILAMMQMEARTCVFIDDIPANVAAAQAVGLHGIVFEDNSSCLAALTRLLAGNTEHTLAREELSGR